MPWWMYEAAIWFFLVIVGAALVEIITKHSWRVLKQRKLWLAFVVLFCAWTAIFYGSFIEPRILLVHRETVEVDKLTQTVRVALLSDFHVGPYKRAGWVEEVVARTNKESPDLVLLLGDYVFGRWGGVEDLKALAKLSAPLGVYAVLGNHDYDADRQEEVKKKLEELGVRVLVNSSKKISLPEGASLCLAGLNDLWNGPEPAETLSGCSAEDTILLMSHSPDAILFDASRAADLLVAAHTHGGQIRLPFLGPAAFVPTVLSKKYSQGLFNLAGTETFITSGLGETGPRARFFNPPEIAVLELN